MPQAARKTRSGTHDEEQPLYPHNQGGGLRTSPRPCQTVSQTATFIGPGRDAARAPYVKHSSSVFANFMTEYGKMKDDDKIAFSSKHLALSRYLLSFYPGTPGGEGP